MPPKKKSKRNRDTGDDDQRLNHEGAEPPQPVVVKMEPKEEGEDHNEGGDGPRRPATNTSAEDDDRLDKEELKAMLKQSFDEKAELLTQKEEVAAQLEETKRQMDAQLEESKKQADSKEEERRNLWLQLIVANAKAEFAENPSAFYYPNHSLLNQAEAVGEEIMKLLRLLLSSQEIVPSQKAVLQSLTTSYFGVDTCTELVDAFENGVKAGTELHEKPTNLGNLFVVAVIYPRIKEDPPTVLLSEDSRALCLPIVAGTGLTQARRSYKLLLHLSRKVDAELPTETATLISPDGTPYPEPIQQLVQEASYNAVLKDLWIPQPRRYWFNLNEPARALQATIDLDRMVETRVGSADKGITFRKLESFLDECFA